VDIILFGGEPYNEPIVVEGTFVMNTPHELHKPTMITMKENTAISHSIKTDHYEWR